ncbi:uncharacterized protein LOC135226798 [Macrobrachium nipponense]|uniref:uncharacterized protein LOC135226798 n=1 Tax=Macrobrachium nipponense TaxID=159736 RepID=UPI0030C88D2C
MVGAQASSITRHFLTLLGCLLLVSSVSAQRGCQFRPGVQGICREITQCPIVLENLRNRVSFPILCGGFNRRNPIVCCPSDGVTVTPQPQTDISEPSPPVECGVPVPVIGDVRVQASREQAIQRISQAQAAKVEGFQSDVQPLVVVGYLRSAPLGRGWYVVNYYYYCYLGSRPSLKHTLLKVMATSALY